MSYYFFKCFLLNTGECKNILKDKFFIIYGNKLKDFRQ